MGREVGGGIGMGNTRKSWLIHVNVWQKSLQYCKVISLQLIKINEKKYIYIFLGSKITVDGACSHEIKRRLLLGRKAVTNLDSALKNRNILPTKVHIV